MKPKIRKLISNPMAFGSVLMVGGSMSVNAINYIYHLVMGRVLGPEQYGVLASIYSLLYIVSIIPQSSSITIVKFISQSKTEEERAHVYKGIERLVRNVSLWGMFIIVILSPIIKNFLNIQSIWPVLLVAPIFYFSILTVSNQAVLQGVLLFFGVVVTNFATSIIKLIFGLILIYVGLSVGGAIFAIVFGMAVSYWLSTKYIKRHIKETKKETTFDISKFIKYSGPVIIQALAFTSLFTIDLVLVKHFFPDFDAGLYAALSTLGKIIFFAASPITLVMFPLVSGKKAKGESVTSVFLMSLLAVTGISALIVVFYAIFPTQMVGLLYGKKYIDAAYALPWMGAFIGVYTICQQIVNFYLSIDKTNIVVLPLIAAILQIVLIWFFHGSLLIVIQISLGIVLCMGLLLLIKLMYNHIKLNETK